MLPEYQGPNLRKVAVTSDIFEGMKFDAYNDESDDGTEDEEEEAPQSAGPAPRALGDDDGRARDIVTPVEEDSGPLSEWFRVKKEDVEGSIPQMFPEDSETENDSDNADVAEPEEPDLDEWFKVKDERDEGSVASTSKLSEDYDKIDSDKDGDVKMGETDDAMSYDPDVIFRHLCFYLDSPDNARNHGMTVRTKFEKEIEKSFSQVAKLITENGGKIVDLDEPKLTHVVIDKRDGSRRLELMKRTSKPKRRQFVISEYIEACLDEETLLDEDEFAP
ncbi:hypothetical protein MD484_g1743, partial [Candolleomyces efflorescens]